jgi:hypothetical protein
MDLDEHLEKVNSKQTFFEFLDALKKDKEDEDRKDKENSSTSYSSGANGWENGSISSFLESMHAFGHDSTDLKMDWKSFALLLYSGKFYE